MYNYVTNLPWGQVVTWLVVTMIVALALWSIREWFGIPARPARRSKEPEKKDGDKTPKTGDQGTVWGDLKKWWEKFVKNGTFLPLLVIFGGIWFCIFLLFQMWWPNRWSENWGYIIAALAMILVASQILPKPRVPLKIRSAWVLLVLAVFVLGNFVFLDHRYSVTFWENTRLAWKGMFWNTPGAGENSGFGNTNYAFPAELEGNKNAKALYDVIMPAVKNQRDGYIVWRTCGLESNKYDRGPFQQFEKDGKTPLIGLHEDETPNGAIGICQIKPEFYGDRSLERSRSTGLDFSLETLEGQGRMAAWIVNNDPRWRTKWDLSTRAERIVNGNRETYTASVRPSVPQAAPRQQVVAPAPRRVITRRSDLVRELEITLKPGAYKTLENVEGSGMIVRTAGQGTFGIAPHGKRYQRFDAKSIEVGAYGPKMTLRNLSDESDLEEDVEMTFRVTLWQQ